MLNLIKLATKYHCDVYNVINPVHCKELFLKNSVALLPDYRGSSNTSVVVPTSLLWQNKKTYAVINDQNNESLPYVSHNARYKYLCLYLFLKLVLVL